MVGLTRGVPLLLLALIAAPPAHGGGEAVGQVIMAVGEVVALDAAGTERRLQRRSAIFDGERLVTRGAESRAQIRFADGALVALRPETELRIDSYRYQGDESDSAVYDLLRGGLRTLTGAIGRGRESGHYEVGTPVGTIGIRGTHYALQYCGADCARREGQAAGLYGGVLGGKIALINDAGETTFATDHYFHAASIGARPRRLLAPPSFLINDLRAAPPPDDEEEGAETADETRTADADGAADEAAEPESGTLTGALSNKQTAESLGTAVTTDLTGSTAFTPEPEAATHLVTTYRAPAGSGLALAFVGRDDRYYHYDGTWEGEAPWRGFAAAVVDQGDEWAQIWLTEGMPSGLEFTETGHDWNQGDGGYEDDYCDPCILSVGSARLVEKDATGGGPRVYWGRWHGDYRVSQNGEAFTTTYDLHQIYSPDVTPYDSLAQLTTLGNSVIYGGAKWFAGTSPTDLFGNVGTLEYVELGIDFASQGFTSAALSVKVDGVVYSVAGNSDPLWEGSFERVLLHNEPLWLSSTTDRLVDAELSPLLVGPNAERLMGSYGIWEYQFDATHGGSPETINAISGTFVADR